MKEQLIEAAKRAYQHAYVPYSKFPVGAAILLDDGTIHTGANIENASYGLTLCAERTCLAHAYSVGVKKEDIVMMAIAVPQSHQVSPCGACRQVMRELVPLNTPVYLVHTKGVDVITNDALLPLGFDADDL
jgi:cytidine deaminase